MLFSVVIPTYNSERFIEETLNSVFDQTWNDYELIVSDDGSTDGTKDLVRRLFEAHRDIRCRLIENEHRGAGGSRNAGISTAAGDWIAFLDSDDIWYKDKLRTVAACIKKNSDIGLWCNSELMRIGQKKIVLEHYKKFNPDINQFLALYRSNALSPSAVTVRRDLIVEAGLFDETLLAAQDYEAWLRLAGTAKIEFIHEVLGEYRVRGGNISSNPLLRLRCMFRIAHKHHRTLKLLAQFPFLERVRFSARSISAAGAGCLSQKKIILGIIFLFAGFLLWPFRGEGIKRLLGLR